MFLHMTHVIDKQFQEAHLTPWEFTELTSLLVGQRFNGCAALLPTMLEITMQFVLRIWPWRDQSRRVQFFERERRRWREAFHRARQVKIKPEEGVIDNVPERLIFGAIRPKLIGTGQQRIFEHVDSCPELRPDDIFPDRVHSSPPVQVTKTAEEFITSSAALILEM